MNRTPASEPAFPRPVVLRVATLAAVLVGLDLAKPVTVDDPALLRQAIAWASHPASPWSGETFLYQTLVPAASVALPPVGTGVFALGIALFGLQPVALKLLMLPFALLLVAALDRLAHRVAPAAGPAIVTLLVLSPWCLPSLNLMLDLPALALALAALAVIVSPRHAGVRAGLAAGILAGLALQTKYTVLPVVAILPLAGEALGRRRAGWTAALAALATFLGIEAATLFLGGASPLAAYASGRGARDPGGHHWLLTARRSLLMWGSVAAPLLPLGLLAAGAPGRVAALAIPAVAAGFAVFAFAPETWVRALDAVTAGRVLRFETATLGWMGPLLVALAAIALGRAVRAAGGRAAPVGEASAESRGRGAVVAVLGGWWLLECVVAPSISASASARRLIGASFAAGLLFAGLVEPRLRRGEGRVVLRAGLVLGVALGIAFALVDLDSARSDLRLLEDVRARVASRPPGTGVAFVAGHWGGFPFAAERAGWRPVALGRSTLAPGDRLIRSFDVEMRGVTLDRTRVAPLDSIPLRFVAPVTTRRAYYDGRIAIRRPDPSWIGARIDTVTAAGEVLRSRVPPR